MPSDDLRAWRAEVIEGAINVETLINAIICQHYFGRVSWEFFRDVLLDEQFSFGLRRRILEKIATGEESAKTIHQLNRLITIRNYFAHCGAEVFGAVPGKGGVVLDPKKPSRPLDFLALRDEFRILLAPVHTFLRNLYVQMGGVLNDTPFTLK